MVSQELGIELIIGGSRERRLIPNVINLIVWFKERSTSNTQEGNLEQEYLQRSI